MNSWLLPWVEASENAKTVVYAWALVVADVMAYVTVRYHGIRRERGFRILSLAGLISGVGIYVGLSTVTESFVMRFSIGGLSTMLAGLSVIAAVLLVYAVRWTGTHLWAASIKEGIDRLPTGLCFYEPSGFVKLSNTCIEKLCVELTGRLLLDGGAFWEAVRARDCTGEGASEDAAIIRLGDGRVWSVRRSFVGTQKEPIYEVSAADISEEWEIAARLREREREAKTRNARLKALSRSIGYLAMEREALSAKIRIHDRLGQRLLMAKRYLLLADSEGGEQALRDGWLLETELILSNRRELWQQAGFVAAKDAEALGIRIELTGELPSEEGLSGVIDTAIRVCATNVLRHAGGSVLQIAVTETFCDYEIAFTNDGEPPLTQIRESGGLRNLRREAESLGGEMRIEWDPEFRLTLRLPKEEKTDAVSGPDRG